jgi:predicted O-methyltransferase YrrM
MSQDNSGAPEWPQFSSEVMRQGPAIRKAHMRSLVRHLKEKHGLKTVNILEIGSWAGASTITWARAIKDLGLTGSVHCVDIWEPYFDLEANPAEIYAQMNRAADHNGIFNEFHRNITAASVEDIVTITRGNSRRVLPAIANDSYQIVFIDASHLYADVYSDILEAKRLVVDGGMVCGDDFELPVGAADPMVHRQALLNNIDFMKDPSSGVRYHPGVSQAIAETLGNVSVWDGFWAVRRRGTNFDTIGPINYESDIPDHLRGGEKLEVAVVIRSEFGFNVIQSQGFYIACRQALGKIDFSIPLDALKQSYASSDLFVADSLEDILINLCDLKIKQIRTYLESAPIAELVATNMGFNVIFSQGLYAGCRQSLGPVDFTVSLQSLSRTYSPDDLFFESTREKTLLRICEIEKTRLSQLVAARSEQNATPEVVS